MTYKLAAAIVYTFAFTVCLMDRAHSATAVPPVSEANLLVIMFACLVLGAVIGGAIAMLYLDHRERRTEEAFNRMVAANRPEATDNWHATDLQRVQRHVPPLRMPPPQCWCETCRPITLTDMRMPLCPDCGNKRCPRATNHRNACTRSNAPGQPGSSYSAMAGGRS